MKRRPVILDAGPALTFCAANKQRLLHDTLAQIGDLKAPEQVDLEIRNKAKPHTKFAPAARNWHGLVSHGYIALLSDALTDDLAAAMQTVAGIPMAERMNDRRDLGETMVVAHALMLRDRGDDVVVLIDEWRGADIAASHGLRVFNTHGVLKSAARRGFIADRRQMRAIYDELRNFDDGLVHIDQPELLKASTWARKMRG